MLRRFQTAGPLLQSVTALLLFLPLFAVPAAAQQAPLQQPPDDIQQMMVEYQEIQQRYSQIQTQAFMANTELQERQVEINDLVIEAFFSAYPQAEAQIARLDELQAEAMAAQEAQNVELLGQLMGEAGMLQEQLQTQQELVLASDSVKPHIDSFEADFMALMVDIDPEAQQMRTRLDELAALLTAAMPSPF